MKVRLALAAVALVIYCRYSSDMQRKDSCSDQLRKVREGLDRVGVDHRNAVVLKDEEQSGTKETRAAYDRIRSMINRKERFILAVDDQSRLSRGDNVKGLIRDLIYAGGRFISVGENIDTDQPGWEMKVGLLELHNSLAISEIARRVRRGQEGRILDGCGSAGDYCYGYTSQYVDPNWAKYDGRGPKPKKAVIIDDGEKVWVIWIFERFVEGASMQWIARELNRLSVPTGGRRKRKGWHHYQIKRILTNKKYIGVWAWGATTTKRNSAGKKRQDPVPPKDVIVAERPALRIVPQDLWEKAQLRMARLHSVYGMKPGQAARGPRVHHTSVYPPNLLSGLLVCGECGHRMSIQCGGPRNYFGCSRHRMGVCAMTYRVPRAAAEQAVLKVLGEILLAWPEWMAAAKAKMERALKEYSQRGSVEVDAAQRRLEAVDKAIGNLVRALELGGDQILSVTARLTELQDEKAALERRLVAAKEADGTHIEMPPDEWIRAQLADLATLLRQNTQQSGLVLRKIVDKVVVRPVLPAGKRRGYGQLRFRIRSWSVLAQVLNGKVSQFALDAACAVGDDGPEFHIDIGGPTRMDRWGPEVVRMRAEGITWKEITRITGLKAANAAVAMKRWLDAQEPPDKTAQQF